MRYIPELDGVRAVAVAAVVLFHADIDGDFSGGFVGVDLFFVLSGFLITSILASEWGATGKLNLWSFYGRRLLRLMPPLLLLLAVYLVAAPVLWPGHDHALDALLAALYLSDYSYALSGLPFYLQHTWSLAVEEHYYLLWPLALPLLLRSKRPLVWLAVAWTIVTIWRTSYIDNVAAFYRFDTRASGLILGGALYFAALKASKPIAWLGLSGFAALVLTASFNSAMIAIPLTELAAAALVVGAVNLSGLRHPLMVLVGKLSYGIYLWHFPIVLALRDNLSFIPLAVATFALSLGAAALSYYTVEAWARRAKTGLSNLKRLDDHPERAGIGYRCD